MLWFVYVGDALVGVVKGLWPAWQASPWSLHLFALVRVLPSLFLVWLAFKLASGGRGQSWTAIHHTNLKQLDEAKVALSRGLSSLDHIEREYSGKLALYDRLQAELKDLQEVKAIDTEDLRRKLDAIARARWRASGAQLFVAFLVGVFSSLVANWLSGLRELF